MWIVDNFCSDLSTKNLKTPNIDTTIRLCNATYVLCLNQLIDNILSKTKIDLAKRPVAKKWSIE